MLKKIIVAASILILFLVLASNSNPKKIRIIKPSKDYLRVMVIDSGINPMDDFVTKKLCKHTPYKDLTETGMQDEDNHGSLVLSLLTKHALDSPYCLHVIKYHDGKSGRHIGGKRFLQAMELVNKLKPDIVNISSGGTSYEGQELNVIKNNPKTIFMTAAGNENESLDEPGVRYYPASYAYFENIFNVKVIGALDEYGKKLHSSNWGSVVSLWELGEYPEGTGTSFAAPVATGKLIYELTHKKVIEE